MKGPLIAGLNLHDKGSSPLDLNHDGKVDRRDVVVASTLAAGLFALAVVVGGVVAALVSACG